MDVRELVRVIGNSEGTIQKLLKDPSLYNRLDETLCAVKKLLPYVEQILKDVEVFTDKIARHPEALGIRGAIAPDNGLKNPPSPLNPQVPRPKNLTPPAPLP